MFSVNQGSKNQMVGKNVAKSFHLNKGERMAYKPMKLEYRGGDFETAVVNHSLQTLKKLTSDVNMTEAKYDEIAEAVKVNVRKLIAKIDSGNFDKNIFFANKVTQMTVNKYLAA